MTSALRTALLVAGVFAAVILASIFYARMVRQAPQVETAPSAAPAVAPGPIDPAGLHPGIQEGLRAFQDNRLDDARTSFESVPVTDTSYLVARQNLAAVLVRAGDFAGADRTLEEISKLQPDSAALAEQRAWVQYRLGNYEKAELYALRGLEIDGRQPQLRYAIGLFRAAAGRTMESVAAYKRGMQADTERRHVAEALGPLMTLAQERPDLPGVHYLLAFFANALRQTALEIQELERCLAVESTGPLADAARARLAEARGGAASAAPRPSPTPGS